MRPRSSLQQDGTSRRLGTGASTTMPSVLVIGILVAQFADQDALAGVLTLTLVGRLILRGARQPPATGPAGPTPPTTTPTPRRAATTAAARNDPRKSVGDPFGCLPRNEDGFLPGSGRRQDHPAPSREARLAPRPGPAQSSRFVMLFHKPMMSQQCLFRRNSDIWSMTHGTNKA